ncbi:pancreatic lipase-related protein 2-like [Episyrphus balteatus]|uniref:pancreatic lipase-related protein 2-like n=1 Tax=Episyrphus balteatus TaxID=286459 RepID=UPI0024850C57|nr:pancreatic lipase-related protein 2-like [Episyrphus balteatus]
MKTLAALLLLSVTLICALPIEESNEVSEDGYFVPQLDWSLKWMSAEEIKKEQLKTKARNWFNDRPVDFHLYTRKNPKKSQKISPTDLKGLKKSNFNSNHPTRIIIHGWQNSHQSELNVVIREALLQVMDCNVISVDWSRRLNYFTLNYLSATYMVPKVGVKVAKLIDFLVDEGEMSLDDLHVIGHSLGAHVSGIAGKNVRTGEVHTIIGLDPAGPLYEDAKNEERLTKDDARYVEVIHTNGGTLGFLEPIGHADFYANGGQVQPGCFKIDVVGLCAHLRSYWYYAESIIENSFKSMKCQGYTSAILNTCHDVIDEIRLGGADNYELASGEYYTPVNELPPYGRGDKFNMV